MGSPKHYERFIGHSIQHNYYDYIDAWSTSVPSVPSWFLRWWNLHRASNEIIPTDLMDQVTYFSSSYKITSHMSQFPVLFLFMSKYKVPWIFKWQYNIANNIVNRQYFIKWWDGFK